jgi:hypothetical protein
MNAATWKGTALALALGALAFAGPVAAQQECGLNVTCTVEPLGGEQYRVTYRLANVSMEPTAIFKWWIEAPSVAGEWLPVSFDVPEGWKAAHHTGRLDFETPNGDFDPHRLYAPAGACGGPDTLAFAWVLDRNGGPVPDVAGLEADDFRVHVQGLDPADCRNLGDSFLCPSVLPEYRWTWGQIKSRFGR